MSEQQWPDPVAPGEGSPRGEPFFNLPGVVTAIIAVMAAIEAVKDYLLSEAGRTWLFIEAAVIPARYGPEGGGVEGAWFWSPVTYSLLHGGWAHLVINSVWLAAFGAIVARRIGTARFLLLWVLSAVASAVLFIVLHPGELTLMVGASGVVSAMMAAAARFAFQGRQGYGRNLAHLNRRLTIAQSLSNRMVVTFLAIWFGINLLAAIGVSSGPGETAIAWEAHVGGFLFGFLAFDWFDRRPDGPQAPVIFP